MPKEYRVGHYDLLLPDDHLLDYYDANWYCHNKAIQEIARLVFQKYPQSSAIDIGANVGDTAALIQTHQQVPVLCVEGNPEFLEYLDRNAAVIGNVEIADCFVGNDGDVVNLELIYSKGGTTSILDALNSEGVLSAEMKSLKKILQEHPNFQTSKLLKVDTDGFDFVIIQASIEIISELKPIIYFEYDISLRSESLLDSLNTLELLMRSGYEKFIVYDNFGNYLISLSNGDIDRFIDLNAYLFSNRYKSGKPAVFYFDVCAFRQEDMDLFEEIRRMAIELC